MAKTEEAASRDAAPAISERAIEAGSDEREKLEEMWAEFQSGAPGYLGGHLTAPPGTRFGLPLPEYGWMYLEHNLPAPTTLRYLILPASDARAESTILYWDPNSGAGVEVSGTPDAFAADANRAYTEGGLTVGWSYPERADTSGKPLTPLGSEEEPAEAEGESDAVSDRTV